MLNNFWKTYKGRGEVGLNNAKAHSKEMAAPVTHSPHTHRRTMNLACGARPSGPQWRGTAQYESWSRASSSSMLLRPGWLRSDLQAHGARKNRVTSGILCRVLLLCVLFPLACTAHAADAASAETNYYQIISLPIPTNIVLEAGALQLMPNKQLAVSTRLGDIYLIDGAFENPPTRVKFNLFASGLHEVLGLALHDGWLYCTQRGEVTRLKDTNGDGRADLFETVAAPWGLSGDYHEYAFGSKFDREGFMWVVLCLTGSFTSDVEYRGWCFRISPEGKAIPTASGLRSPGGIGTNSLGDMFYTDNQGPWNGACALKHLKPGSFQGHPGGNRWYELTDTLGPRPQNPKSGSRLSTEAKRIPELLPPAVYFPYPKMGQSASGIVCDATDGKFGPFQNQLFVGGSNA